MSSNGSKALPPGYTSIHDILTKDTLVQSLVSVMGLVKDFRAPIATKGTDHKCTITIMDKSAEDAYTDLPITVFRPLNEMPSPASGDVLVVKMGKVQTYRNSNSIITHHNTTFYVYSASQIPTPPQSAQHALQPSSGRPRQPLSEAEHQYISWLYHDMNKDAIPDAVTFQTQVAQSLNVKDKFRTLDNVTSGLFCDVIVHVVRAPYQEMDMTTLWVSDYTENEHFHKFSWEDTKAPANGNSLLGGSDRVGKWTGPFGKRSMQVTAFESHAVDVKARVQLGQWIYIRNLRVKQARNGINLEGALHEDREYHRRQVEVLDHTDKDNLDPRLKEAIRRKLQYEKLKKKQIKSFRKNGGRGGAQGVKRKADAADLSDAKPLNARERRKENRKAVALKVQEQERQAEERLGLNDLVKCESSEQPVTPVYAIVEPATWNTTLDGKEVSLTLPFTCAKYRTNARVVDFRPQRLEDFASWRKSTEADVLSDFGSDSSSESESSSEDSDSSDSSQDAGTGVWEWHFALQLEGVDPKSKNNAKFWVLVDNNEAQQLTSLDACDLRKDQETLETLREQLFKLWGNLEEAKLKEQETQLKNRQRIEAKLMPPSSPPPPAGTQQRNNSGQAIAVSNKPFTCCIQEYGVRVRELDPALADAGDGRRWMRTFGLFGTKICS
ncbi:hypothetical protein F5Y17DRAFT_420509 [Xylariaceae sp. FL0594]|nr:hypothetical protein F5Y17DRAFT_420509 [Xylariaceae sp. FL0594]